MLWSNDADNYVIIDPIIDQLALNLVQICLDNTLQILYKSSVLCFAKVGNIDYTQKSQKFGL